MGKTKRVGRKEAKTEKLGRSRRKVKTFGVLVRKRRMIGIILAKVRMFGITLAKPKVFVIIRREVHISGKAGGKSKFFLAEVGQNLNYWGEAGENSEVLA